LPIVLAGGGGGTIKGGRLLDWQVRFAGDLTTAPTNCRGEPRQTAGV